MKMHEVSRTVGGLTSSSRKAYTIKFVDLAGTFIIWLKVALGEP